MQSFSCRNHCVPENSPLLWLILNGLCVQASLSLVGIILSGHNQTAESVYMEYNIIRSIVWLLGIGLTLGHLSETRPTRKQLIAVVVAIYFLADSCRTIYLWTLQRPRRESLLVDICIDVMIFTILAYSCFFFLQNKIESIQDIVKIITSIQMPTIWK